MSMKSTHRLDVPGAAIVYDVFGATATAGGRPPLLMIGQPMDAGGFAALASLFPERTVVTYDPRGLGRSERTDGRDDNDPDTQAADLHRLVQVLGDGPVDVFASSGGAITGLALVSRYPADVATLVAHEPPLFSVLRDAPALFRARAGIRDAYEARGWGAGMAAFIALTSWRGELTEAFFDQPPPDPAAFGLPTTDDGRRDDPLLSDLSWAVTDYQPDFDALAAAPTRIVVAVGEESAGMLTARTAAATASRLGREATVFPSHHGGFVGGDGPYAGQPEAFARRLREVLDASSR